MNGAVARAAPPGSTIGVVTPGSPPETRAEVQRGIGWWESKGYRVKLMPGALEEDGWHAGSPEVRASDLQAAFADPEIDAIQTMRGGSMAEIAGDAWKPEYTAAWQEAYGVVQTVMLSGAGARVE